MAKTLTARSATCYAFHMAKINLGVILESLEAELRRSFRAVVAEDHTNSLFRAFLKKVKDDKTWYTVPDHLVEKDRA